MCCAGLQATQRFETHWVYALLLKGRIREKWISEILHDVDHKPCHRECCLDFQLSDYILMQQSHHIPGSRGRCSQAVLNKICTAQHRARDSPTRRYAILFSRTRPAEFKCKNHKLILRASKVPCATSEAIFTGWEICVWWLAISCVPLCVPYGLVCIPCGTHEGPCLLYGYRISSW